MSVKEGGGGNEIITNEISLRVSGTVTGHIPTLIKCKYTNKFKRCN